LICYECRFNEWMHFLYSCSDFVNTALHHGEVRTKETPNNGILEMFRNRSRKRKNVLQLYPSIGHARTHTHTSAPHYTTAHQCHAMQCDAKQCDALSWLVLETPPATRTLHPGFEQQRFLLLRWFAIRPVVEPCGIGGSTECC
jgi:hypothetical protein